MFSSVSGKTLVFLGALFWSLNAPIVKFLNLDSLLIVSVRSIIASIALAAFIRPKQLNWNGWMLLSVCSYAALCWAIIVSLGLTSSPVALGMQYTATIWLFILNWIKTKSFAWQHFFPICVIIIGVVFFMSSGTNSDTFTGNLIALSEGVFFAAMTVSSKKAAGNNPLGLTAIANIFTGLLFFLLFPASSIQITQMSLRDWGYMLLLGSVQTACGYGFYNLGVQHVSAQKASIFSLWELILGPLWVFLFLNEYPSVPVLIGLIIILVGMYLDAKFSATCTKITKNA